MARSEQNAFVNARPRCRSAGVFARRAVAVLVAAMFIVLALGFVARPSGAAHDPAAGAVSAPGIAGRVSIVGRTPAVNSSFALAPPVARRRMALGDLSACALALAVAYLFGKRASLGAGRRLRFDAVFAFRRGPPSISVAY